MDDHFWGCVIFSNEERFTCDAPDCLQSYCHDLRKDDFKISKRHCEGNGVVVWAGFCAHKKSALVHIYRRLNTFEYICVLEGHLLPWTDDSLPVSCIVKQDNTPDYATKKTKEKFSMHSVRVVEWPSRSPGLNLWDVLARNVYAINRQFPNTTSLLECIILCWGRIEKSMINGLVKSMYNRCHDVVATDRGVTKY